MSRGSWFLSPCSNRSCVALRVLSSLTNGFDSLKSVGSVLSLNCVRSCALTRNRRLGDNEWTTTIKIHRTRAATQSALTYKYNEMSLSNIIKYNVQFRPLLPSQGLPLRLPLNLPCQDNLTLPFYQLPTLPDYSVTSLATIWFPI